MDLWRENEEIVIWGSGELAQKTFYRIKGKYSPVYFIDNEVHNPDELLLGFPLYSADKSYVLNRKVIIASSAWMAISRQLISYGKKPVLDFVPFWMFGDYGLNFYDLFDLDGTGEAFDQLVSIARGQGKKISIICGNCQTRVIRTYLNANLYFRRKFVVFNIPMIFDFREEHFRRESWLRLWSCCDLLITQNIGIHNRFHPMLAFDSIKPLLKTGCEIIKIPNLYFKGYFPGQKKNEKNVLTKLTQAGLFPTGDRYIEQMFSEGKSAEQIIERMKHPDFIPAREIRIMVDKSLEEFLLREQKNDIKMFDLILENYSQCQLFYNVNHPNNGLLKRESERILRYIGICRCEFEKEELFDLDINYSLRGQDALIYPAVQACIGLEISDIIYYPNRFFDDRAYTFEEYIKEYIRICLMDN